MPANRKDSHRTSDSSTSKSRTPRAQVAQETAYEELPELIDEMFARGVFSKGGRPVSKNPRVPISLRLPADVLAKWRATGPGWQARMVERLRRVR